MAENKTTENALSVEAFLDRIEDLQKRKDAYAILELMKQATKKEAKMWGTAIIGFGKLNYQYESGRKGEIFNCGFSPRKSSFSLYLHGGLGQFSELFKKLGKHKTAKGCIYVSKLADVNPAVLKEMFKLTMTHKS
jgi:hypothetical protein